MSTSFKYRLLERVARFMPGVPVLLRYDAKADFRHDLIAGLSVASVALPVAVAYAQLAGFNPVVGLYSCILPLIVYALFGTSRQLIVSPDAATCAMIAASVAPLAGGDADRYWSLAVTLTFFTGLFCILASLLRLGALADFLSKPILIGFLNGVAISILLGQIGKVFGFTIESGGIVPRLWEFIEKLPLTHWPTLALGLGTFALLITCKRHFPLLPSTLLAMVCSGLIVALFHLEDHGVAILGEVPAGLPPLQFPTFPLEHLPAVIASAAGLALVLFSSGMLTARSFADKNRYSINVDREFAAFGAANIASAISQGFAITGADSRTAMADATGGRTQVTGLVAAVTIAAVLLFFTHPLQYVPITALGAVLVYAGFSLFDTRTLRDIWRIDRSEVALSVITMMGVVAVGAIDAILVAVTLALMRFVRIAARPRDEILGRIEGVPGWHSVVRHPETQTFTGIVVYRFDGPITFFNATYMKERTLQVAEMAGVDCRWVVLDMIPVSHIDVTGLYAIRDLLKALDERGIRLVFAGRKSDIIRWSKTRGLYTNELDGRSYSTMRQAMNAFREATSPDAGAEPAPAAGPP